MFNVLGIVDQSVVFPTVKENSFHNEKSSSENENTEWKITSIEIRKCNPCTDFS